MKAVARRSKGLEDTRTIAKNSPNLDISRVERWVKAFAEILETPDLWTQVKKMLTD
jgi:hypothetical protein